MTVQDLAGTAYDSFERKEREDGAAFYTLKDDAPDWLQPIIFEAHDGKLPDDFTYSACMDAFGFIHDNDGSEEDASEFADSNVSVYAFDLLEWVGSHIDRVGLCDETAEEFGEEDAGLVRRLTLGQYAELRNIYAECFRGLQDVADGEES